MSFLKRLFGGDSKSGSSTSASGGGKRGFGGDSSTAYDKNGIYFYVKPRGCDEIVRVRVDRNNDLSLKDEGGYFIRKVARGTVCLQNVELELTFSPNREFVDAQITNGEIVDEAAYAAWTSANS